MSGRSPISKTRADYLKRLLVPFWLRPESALWYAHEAFLAHQYLGENFAQPSLELGCMDGTATFIMLGGEFGMGFDVYKEVAWQSPGRDYFDNVGQDAIVDIQSRPPQTISVGLSWKRSHLEKAGRLGTYGRLVEHDPNLPLTLFGDQEFATIWGPNLYWMDKLDQLLRETRRILKSDGRLITVLPDSSALEHSLYRFKDSADAEWIENLDRGRYANISRQARSLAEWEKQFQQAGLTISRHVRFIPSLLFQVNDIGLRPLFPVLMDIYETLQRNPEDLQRIKQHWIETALRFLMPLCDLAWMDSLSFTNVWHIFELQPCRE